MPLASRTALVLLAGAFLPAPLQAQVRLALTAGLASTTLEQEFAGSTRPVERATGPVVGVSARHPVGAGVSLVGELMYVARGGGDPTSDATLRFRYLTVPVMLRYDLDHGRPAAPFVAAGATTGYLASCTLDDGLGHAEACDAAYGEDGGFARIDIGLALAAGIRLGNFAVAVRREIGLRNIDRAAGFTTRNRAWLVTMAIGL